LDLVETWNFASHTRECLFLFEEVVKAEAAALRALAVHAHTLLSHTECHGQNNQKYHDENN